MPPVSKCPTNDDLDAFRAGEADGNRIASISRHLDDCTECQAKLDTTERLVELLRVPPPSTLVGEAGYRRLDDWAFSDATRPFEPTTSHERPRLRPADPGTDDLGRVGPYRILRILGEGAMGVVYEASDTRLDRRVALKVLKPSWSGDAGSRDRFLREAKAAAKIIDDRIVAVFDVGDDEGVPYIAMALVQGQSLERRLRDQPHPPIAEVVDLARQIAMGLSVAHAHGLVHRDIKPANIWIETVRVSEQTPHGFRVKLLDFGLARSLSEDVRITQSGTVIGTPAYMSPEQAAGNDADARSDLFSLGCILYRMTTGSVPFTGKDTLAVVYALANKNPVPPRRVNPETPEPLSSIVMKLLEKNPAKRFESAQDVIDALDSKTTAARRWPIARIAVAVATACLATIALWFAIGRPTSTAIVPDGKSAVAAKAGIVKPAPSVDPGNRPWQTPAFQAWAKDVATLSAQDQLQAVSKKLVELNPGFDGTLGLDHPEMMPTIEDGKVTRILFFTYKISDISPVVALKDLKQLFCVTSNPLDGILTDLSPLRGMPLSTLHVSGNPGLFDLSPLAGMPLTELNVWSTKVADLSPIRGMPLTTLSVRETKVEDLSPLKGMSLTTLDLTNNRSLTDLSPIAGMKIESLCLNSIAVPGLSHLQGMPLHRLEANFLNHVTDLSPLMGMPLEHLEIVDCPNVTDLSPIKGLPLKLLLCNIRTERDAEVVRSIKTLRTINGMPAAEFWTRFELPTNVPGQKRWETPAFQAWMKNVARMPSQQQVDAVAKKMIELNPMFDGKIAWNESDDTAVRKGNVTEIRFSSTNVRDIAPLRALGGLKSLTCIPAGPLDGVLEDLSPLEGMLLTKLWVYGNRKLSDVSPLRGMPLTSLSLWYTQVADLSPLKGLKLEYLNLSCLPTNDLSPLRGMPLTWLDLNKVEGVNDLSDLEGMKLKTLVINEMRIRDLAKLHDMPLELLHANHMEFVEDLSPLKGMPLKELELFDCPKISDFSPIRGLPLKSLRFDFKAERDIDWLRSMTTLRSINGKSATEFWNDVVQQLPAKPPVPVPVAALPEAGQYYRIKNVNSRKVLAVEDKAKDDGAAIVQLIAGPKDHQQWKFVKVDDHYQIINRRSGKALNVVSGSKEEGVPIIQWDAEDDAPNQQWTIERNGEYFIFRAKHSGMVLDVANEAKGRQAPIIQYPYTGGDNQLFELVPITKK